MASKLGYHSRVKRLKWATEAGFGLTFFLLFTFATAVAQINGPPASVTSTGFGGVPGSIHGVAPSVTSLGPRGYTPGFQPFPTNNRLFGVTSNNNINGHNHHHRAYFPLWGYGGNAVPYYPYDNGDYADAPPDDQYNGGPTVFDRRGPGTPARPPANYADNPPSDNASQAEGSSDATPPAPANDQPQTVLVFKDGHQLEVENYAIIGNTLYNLTEGHRQKIALADLDLTATAKQNDDRGIDFQLPGKSEAN